jgi:hypothetical protein
VSDRIFEDRWIGCDATDLVTRDQLLEPAFLDEAPREEVESCGRIVQSLDRIGNRLSSALAQMMVRPDHRGTIVQLL